LFLSLKQDKLILSINRFKACSTFCHSFNRDIAAIPKIWLAGKKCSEFLKHKASEVNDDKHATRATPFDDITTLMAKKTSNTLNA